MHGFCSSHWYELKNELQFHNRWCEKFDPATVWKSYLAYLELRHLPKFLECPQQTVVAQQDDKVMKAKKRDVSEEVIDNSSAK